MVKKERARPTKPRNKAITAGQLRWGARRIVSLLPPTRRDARAVLRIATEMVEDNRDFLAAAAREERAVALQDS